MDGFSLTPRIVPAGVPQGTILSPLLFLMFIDDLASHLDDDLHLFAVDSTLYAVIKTPAHAQSQQTAWNVTCTPLKDGHQTGASLSIQARQRN